MAGRLRRWSPALQGRRSAETPEVIYLEGIYAHPAERGAGAGRRCLKRLSRELLLRTRRVCLLANEENERAHSFYRICGFKLRGVYDSLFLRLD
ncbi:MAG TPA: GNAT family N-acetyltransferase [Pyrinomonadaceae bacterium]|nr:GNAT family N-acetyltransferase [Pyrinomonadaceae bacterium]